MKLVCACACFQRKCRWFLPAAGTPQRGSVRLALRHTLISSFGSISFASLILAAIRALRRALERASRQNIFCCILNCIAQPILEMLEQFTKFATVMTAITGDAFVPAAKSTFTLLKRNFLQTYSGAWACCFDASYHIHEWHCPCSATVPAALSSWSAGSCTP